MLSNKISSSFKLAYISISIEILDNPYLYDKSSALYSIPLIVGSERFKVKWLVGLSTIILIVSGVKP